MKESGFIKAEYGKNIVLEKQYKEGKVKFSYNSKLKRWLFQFSFSPDYSVRYCYSYIEHFLTKVVYTDLNNHKIEVNGASEITLDLKDFDRDFVNNIQAAVNRIRQKNNYSSTTRVNNKFLKLYLRDKGRILRIETKKGSHPNPQEIFSQILAEKEKLLEEEIAQETDFQSILFQLGILNNHVKDVRVQVGNNGMLQELQIESTLEYLTQIEQKLNQYNIDFQENITPVNNILENQTKILEGIAANQINDLEPNTYLQEYIQESFAALFQIQQELKMDLISQLTEIGFTLSQSRLQKQNLSQIFAKMESLPKKSHWLIVFLKKIIHFIIFLIKNLNPQRRRNKNSCLD